MLLYQRDYSIRGAPWDGHIVILTETGVIILPTKNNALFLQAIPSKNDQTHLHQVWFHPKMGPIEWPLQDGHAFHTVGAMPRSMRDMCNVSRCSMVYGHHPRAGHCLCLLGTGGKGKLARSLQMTWSFTRLQTERRSKCLKMIFTCF